MKACAERDHQRSMASCHRACYKASILLLLSFVFMAPSITRTTASHSTSNTTSKGCITAERDALLAFRAELIYDDAHRISSWGNQTDNCCHWAGVRCDNISGHVVDLKLQRTEPSPYSDYYHFCDGGCDGWGLSGNISQSLFRLQHLKGLDLSGNCFINISIPKLLGSLENLVYLELGCSGFTGVIPHELGNLTKLRYLDLEENVRLKVVDDAEWLSGLSSLRYLSMDGANFTGVDNVMQSLNKLHYLKHVSLFGCSMNSISESLPNLNFTSLISMDISLNRFYNMSIPEWLFTIPNLRDLSMGDCGWTGTIPFSVVNATSLQSLDLSFNRGIFGGMPREFGNLCNLQSLYLDGSFAGKSLEEDFRDAFSGCIRLNLNLLSFEFSELHGRLPDWLGEFRNLTSLYLAYNSFNSTIPASIGRLSQLQKLYLSSNSLNGSIPASLGKLSRLQNLHLSYNALNGRIPETLGRLSELQTLTLSNNALTGPIPESLGRLSGLQQLDLSENALSGSIPESLGRLSSALDSENNSFPGFIPSHLGKFGGIPPQLFFLSLSSNNLSGSIPNSLCNLVDLVSLDLSNNHLEGVIPNCWTNLTSLKYVILANNSLAGEIPDSLTSSSQSLEVLHLSNNQLHGEFPSFLERSTSIATLALNHNNLSGNVPTWVGETMTSLMILTLKANNFSGNLPLLSNLTSLHFLDLSHNSFTGRIPQSYGSLTGMMKTTRNIVAGLPGPVSPLSLSIIDASTKGIDLQFRETLPDLKFIDLSANNLAGQIPKDILNLVGLQNLDLSYNHLSGEIPRDIGLMQSLESLDLSRNELNGSIPLGLSTLHFLGSLNLSHNNLFGKIPYAGQLTTFNDPSIYAGNPNLCGAPLGKNCTNDKPTSRSKVDDQDDEDDDDDDSERFWLCIGLMPGFVAGFWIVWGVILFKKEWRYVYFRFLDYVNDMIYVKIVVTMHKIKRS